MMMGRETEMPVDLIIGVPEGENRPTCGVENVDKLGQDMEWVHAMAREHMKIRSDRQKRNYDLKANFVQYEPGGVVWMHNPARKVGVSPKLSKAWEGPFLVTHKLSDVTYRIQRGPKSKLKVVHFDRLKPYTGSSKPEWMTNAIVKILGRQAEDHMTELEEPGFEDTILYDHQEDPLGYEDGTHREGVSLNVPDYHLKNPTPRRPGDTSLRNEPLDHMCDQLGDPEIGERDSLWPLNRGCLEDTVSYEHELPADNHLDALVDVNESQGSQEVKNVTSCSDDTILYKYVMCPEAKFDVRENLHRQATGNMNESCEDTVLYELGQMANPSNNAISDIMNNPMNNNVDALNNVVPDNCDINVKIKDKVNDRNEHVNNEGIESETEQLDEYTVVKRKSRRAVNKPMRFRDV
jgi:hypothetical protein